jgi:hypothetical protein
VYGITSIKISWANTESFCLMSRWIISPCNVTLQYISPNTKNIKLFKNVQNGEFNEIKHEYNSVPITAIWCGMFFYNEMWSTVSEHGQVKLQGILNIVKNTHYTIFNYLQFGTWYSFSFIDIKALFAFSTWPNE